VSGQLDLTNNQRNSFSDLVIEQLEQSGHSLEIIAVVDEQASRDEISHGFNLLNKRLPNSLLSFKSRQSMPIELNNVSEFVQFKLGELEQTVAYPFSQPIKSVIETAIQQMLLRKKHWVTFIEGHGEASLFSKKTNGFKELHETLKSMGWSVAAQNLMNNPNITENTQLIVVASSQTQWLPIEVEKLLSYLKRGKNLLWMMDPGSVMPKAISEYLGVKNYPGSLVDWRGYQSGTPHPAIIIVNQFDKHPTVTNLTSLVAFPWASGLKLQKNIESSIQLKPMINTHTGVWNELDINANELMFNQDKGEYQQAFVLAAAHHNQDNNQRIIVIGDSSFASDSAINNYSNKSFSVNLIHWLTYHKLDQVKQENQDSAIRPSIWGHWLMQWFFSICLPLLLFSVWLLSYWLRVKKLNRNYNK
jgi:hypothetical protein